MKKLKIAILAPIEETVPPTKYGGTELVVFNLITQLVKRGHDVTLYGTGDSVAPCKIVPIVEKAIRTIPPYDTDPKARETAKWIGIGKILSEVQKDEYDIVHSNIGWRMALFGKSVKAPLITTLHGPIGDPYTSAAYSAVPNLPFVSISNNQRKGLPSLNFVDTVYNGIDVSKFPFVEKPEEYLLFLGRFSPEKGPEIAIEVAKRTGKRLIIAAKIDQVDRAFYEKHASKIDGKQIQFVGEISFDEKVKLLGGASALLAPIQWEEPFGLNVTEAMACGTPVLGCPRGSFPEIITDGKTGFLSATVDEMVGRVADIASIDRRECRTRVETYFSIEKMADGYERVYEKVMRV
ncbi:glycosyltransferase family 4 protein [Candidatus Gottesmanbacteria bacterium]|nr:glycosyltransferase family 4 protein [Candidatus Gottesmanbacteria bacterium]